MKEVINTQLPDIEQNIREVRARLHARSLDVQRIDNLDRVNWSADMITMTITLCPLYDDSEINDSGLIIHPTPIYKSRVHGKLVDGLKSVEALKETMTQFGKSLHVIWTFADVGVLLGSIPNGSEEKTLNQHAYLYRRAIREAPEMEGVSSDFHRYSSLEDQALPRFMRVGGRNQEAHSLFEDLGGNRSIYLSSEYFSDDILQNESQQNLQPNGKGSKILRSLIDAFGYETARNFLIQYGFYDSLSSLPDSLNFYFERSTLLLNVTNLFTHKKYPRIDILCS
jgi:hypothetical protein